MARKRGKPRKSRKRASKKPTRPAPSAKKSAGRRRRRYSDAERARILETAMREQLTGAQVRERFGVSTLTFYNWRKKAGSGGASRGPRRRRGRGVGGATSDRNLAEVMRREIRARIGQLLPGIVRNEIAGALGSTTARRGRRRRSRRG